MEVTRFVGVSVKYITGTCDSMPNKQINIILTCVARISSTLVTPSFTYNMNTLSVYRDGSRSRLASDAEKFGNLLSNITSDGCPVGCCAYTSGHDVMIM